MKGIIVFSFGWRENGHSPCNVGLALAAQRIAKAQGEPVEIFAQRTTAAELRKLGVVCHVTKKMSGYEGSEEPMRQAALLFKEMGIIEVIPVAHTFLHLYKCIGLVRREGFKSPAFWKLAPMIGWIGFDPLSVQPATRGPLRCLFYTVRQILFGYRPPVDQSEP